MHKFVGKKKKKPIATKHKIPHVHHKSLEAGKVDGFWVWYNTHFRSTEVDTLTDYKDTGCFILSQLVLILIIN